jgi:hypothetical protein
MANALDKMPIFGVFSRD